ncbi:hypothetical protein M513_11018 [Trichuris suis]|uniref:Bifunctional purine biosynthesis protein ATIC n=1 Tax=Trichuris suis TaxID=68888 RepID=A0A085LSX9_9BILA|nr:hypothetical protein M513_11018 [Trichuris suis]
MATAPEWAIISVYDKKGIVQLANALIQSSKVQVAASDGTYDHLINNGVPARFVVCNFYPFEETVSALGVTDNEVLANIDIGVCTYNICGARTADLITGAAAT